MRHEPGGGERGRRLSPPRRVADGSGASHGTTPIAPASHSSTCGNAKSGRWGTAALCTRNSGRVSGRPIVEQTTRRHSSALRRTSSRTRTRTRTRRAPSRRDVVRHEQRPPQLWVRPAVREPPLLVLQEALAPLGERQGEGRRGRQRRAKRRMSCCSVRTRPCRARARWRAREVQRDENRGHRERGQEQT